MGGLRNSDGGVALGPLLVSVRESLVGVGGGLGTDGDGSFSGMAHFAEE